MPTNVTPRQAVLQKIWGSRGHDDLWELMGRESAARAADIAPELLREADACRQLNPDLASGLEQMGHAVSQVHMCVDQFAAVTNMAELLNVHKSYEFTWTGKFNLILGGFWSDALQSGDQPRIQGLRRGMKLLQNVYVAVHETMEPKGKGEDSWTKKLQSSPLLCDPSFHEFLDRRALFAGKHNHPSAGGFAEMAKYLRFCCKMARAITKIEEHTAAGGDDDGYVEIKLPLTPEQADIWFAISEEFFKAASELAKQINEKSLALQDAVAAIVQFELPEGQHWVRQEKENNQTTATYLTSAFLEHLLLVGSPQSRLDALQHYRDLLTTGHWSSEEAHATFVLRYAKAVLNHWRYVPDPQNRLHEVADLIAKTFHLVDPAKSPRLTRDLWIVRARLLENIGIWNPEAYEDAANSYQRGLDVPNIAFELEARGMALTDYANTLSHLHREDEAALDKKIIATFEEALAVFRTEKRILGGTLARNSYAVYLNERHFGDRIENQERALALAQEAIDLIESDSEEYDPDNDYLRRTIAGPYLTKSNVILQREVGDDLSAHKAAIDALHSAWDKLGKAQDDQLRGIINLDLGHAYIALYGMTGDEAEARNAMYAYQEAEGLLQPYPLEYSQAVLGTAMLVSEVPEYSSPGAIEESLASGEKALALIEQTNDPGALARAWACLAELHLLRGRADDEEAAIDYLLRSRDKFFANGSTENAISAAKRISTVHMKIFNTTHSLDAVRVAKDVLLTAARWVDDLWTQIDSVDWHYLISDRYSEIYADIAWCQATLQEPLRDLVSMVARSKGREFVAHAQELQLGTDSSEKLSEYADQLRVDSRLAERKRWQASRKAKPDIALDEVMRTSTEEMRHVEFARRLLFPRPLVENDVDILDTVEDFLRTHPKTIILDITLSRWGTVAVVFGGRETPWAEGSKVVTLALKTSSIMRPVHEWLSSYFSYLATSVQDREEPRKEWAAATDRLLELLGPELIQPCMDDLGEHALEFVLVIAAGRLAGLPLHATRFKDGRFVAESLSAVEYIPNLSVLSPVKEEWNLPKTALCVASDPFEDLPSTATECKSVAESLAQGGAKVTVLARTGAASGASAFARRSVTVGSNIEVLDANPTPRRVTELMAEGDHFFYSGHGTRSGGQSGLVFVNDEAVETLLSEDEILSMPALRQRPLIVLSACETARGEQGSSELFDVASCFLRVGARYVIGSLWVVRGDCATVFTASFYKQMSTGMFPNRAYGEAIRDLRRYLASNATTSGVPLDHPIHWAPFLALRGE
jgi:CHAT domain-containing protein